MRLGETLPMGCLVSNNGVGQPPPEDGGGIFLTDRDLTECGYRTSPYDNDGPQRSYIGAPLAWPPSPPHNPPTITSQKQHIM